MKRFYNEFWKKLTEDQQAKLLAGGVGSVFAALWLFLLFTGAHIV